MAVARRLPEGRDYVRADRWKTWGPMLLLGKDVSALTGYVMSWVRTTKGVIDTEMHTMLDWRGLASPENIVELVENFFSHNYRGQFR